jgi:16S rRNA (guanine(966)-N(2))-methyltransferase RsmD
MRISGGSARGRKIGFRKAFRTSGKDDELRPTSAKVREALFDIIRRELPGAVFLDLYAGTGGVGIEALSRGASRAVMVESNKLRVRMISQLLSEFDFSASARVVNRRAYDFLEKEEGRGQYDIIFLDPPYDSEELAKLLPLIGGGMIIREGGLVIAEHFLKTGLPDCTGRLSLLKRYKYGDTVLTVYRAGHAGRED